MTLDKKKNLLHFLVLVVLFAGILLPYRTALAQTAVIHAILFYSPTCPHCHEVMTKVIPPLENKYGLQLDIVNVDTTTPLGQKLYEESVEKFNIPGERLGVPTLIVGDSVLVGSKEIPGLFPSIIEKGLATGGIEFSDLPSLPSLLENRPAKTPPSALERFNTDPTGNGISVLVLIGLVFSIIHNGRFFYQKAIKQPSKKFAETLSDPNWWVLILILIGIVVAGYLTYVETTQSEALCGPIGDCNAVQQSPYAVLFGILPVGLFGIVGYISLAVAWIFQSFTHGIVRSYAAVLTFIFSAFGVFFSSYLTFLEPFVIGATCAWCITSAIIMGILLWLTVKPAIAAWYQLTHVSKPAYKRH